MIKDSIEQMVSEIIEFLKDEELWETDTGIYTKDLYYHHHKISTSDREIKGEAFMWFEGPLNHAINHGSDDPDFSILKGLTEIMEQYGYYPEFGTHCDFNIYKIN